MTNSLRIAIDAGHGYTKALSASGRRTLFPSLICPAPATVDLGEFARREVVTIDGTPYLVGDAARRHATPLWSREKATDPDTLRLILIAAAQLGANGPVAFATGLPLSWYGSQRRAFRDALTGYGGEHPTAESADSTPLVRIGCHFTARIGRCGSGSVPSRPRPWRIPDR